jgi:hypothetical protein
VARKKEEGRACMLMLNLRFRGIADDIKTALDGSGSAKKMMSAINGLERPSIWSSARIATKQLSETDGYLLMAADGDAEDVEITIQPLLIRFTDPYDVCFEITEDGIQMSFGESLQLRFVQDSACHFVTAMEGILGTLRRLTSTMGESLEENE